MLRILYIIAIFFLISWLFRIAFPYIWKFFLWLMGRKIEKNFGNSNYQKEKTIDYQVKENKNKNGDDDVIEYEEVD